MGVKTACAAVSDTITKTLKKYESRCQGQRSRSNVPTFIRLIESSRIRYHIKLHQNPKIHASNILK